MTDGTPAACMQKNAKEFLAGNTPGVMAQYAPGLFSTEQKRNSRQPAPDDPEAVKELVRLREEEPYRRGAFGRTFRFADITSGSCK